MLKSLVKTVSSGPDPNALNCGSHALMAHVNNLVDQGSILKTKNRVWADNSVSKNTYYSSRGQRFSSQHHIVDHNYLELQFLGSTSLLFICIGSCMQ